MSQGTVISLKGKAAYPKEGGFNPGATDAEPIKTQLGHRLELCAPLGRAGVFVRRGSR